MVNDTAQSDPWALPPLPEYQLRPQPDLIPYVPDKWLTVFGPIIAYWFLSLFFHWIDVNDYFPQYRLHTPAEVAKRNRASRWEVVRDVIIQQVVQTVVGLILGMTEPDDYVGKEQYDIAVWARRIRIAERAIPKVLALLGINAKQLAGTVAPSHSVVAGALLGGQYSILQTSYTDGSSSATTPGFVYWETAFAGIIYWYLVPTVQFAIGIVIVDTWQYFLHRAMHMNKWLYTTFHSRHHRLYVPYAYGALYNHPFEGFLLDVLGASIAFKVAGMSTRQGLCFFTGTTFKTVDDHCGYAFPWDPLQHLTGNNAGYHDVHHQTWGIKTNFSQPFFTFWDRILGTVWTGGDVSARYERARSAAQKAYDADETSASVTGSDAKTSKTHPLPPYQKDIPTSRSSLSSINPTDQRSPAPSGKAAAQTASSRQQVLDDGPICGGSDVLVQESREEKEAQTRSHSQAQAQISCSGSSGSSNSNSNNNNSNSKPIGARSRAKRSLSQSADDALRGLHERLPSSKHGRTGSLLGMDSGH